MDPKLEILERIRQEYLRASVSHDFSEDERLSPGPENKFRTFALRHPNAWDKKLFIAKCKSFGLNAYRKPEDPLMVNRVNTTEKFYEEVFWPEFHGQVKSLAKLIESLISEVLIEGGPWDHELELPE